MPYSKEWWDAHPYVGKGNGKNARDVAEFERIVCPECSMVDGPKCWQIGGPTTEGKLKACRLWRACAYLMAQAEDCRLE
jgi:hypothetical protein